MWASMNGCMILKFCIGSLCRECRAQWILVLSSFPALVLTSASFGPVRVASWSVRPIAALNMLFTWEIIRLAVSLTCTLGMSLLLVRTVRRLMVTLVVRLVASVMNRILLFIDPMSWLLVVVMTLVSMVLNFRISSVSLLLGNCWDSCAQLITLVKFMASRWDLELDGEVLFMVVVWAIVAVTVSCYMQISSVLRLGTSPLILLVKILRASVVSLLVGLTTLSCLSRFVRSPTR